MKNLKFTPVLLVLFLALIASNSFADKPYNEVIYDTWPGGVHLWNDCVGESADGDLIFKITNHYDKNGNLASQHWDVARGVLIGSVTGLVYNPIGANNIKFDVNDQGASKESEIWLVHAVAPGGHWIKLYMKSRTIINANGDVKFEVDLVNYTCR